MVVYGALDLRHHTLVVVPQADDAGARGADLRDIEVGAGIAVEGCEGGLHCDAMLWLGKRAELSVICRYEVSIDGKGGRGYVIMVFV